MAQRMVSSLRKFQSFSAEKSGQVPQQALQILMTPLLDLVENLQQAALSRDRKKRASQGKAASKSEPSASGREQHHAESAGIATAASSSGESLEIRESSNYKWDVLAQDARVGMKLDDGSVQLESSVDERERKSREYLRRRERQLDLEMGAYKEAALKYAELEGQMFRKKLGINLPVGKSLMLSWFGPLRDAIRADQEAFKNERSVSPYDPDLGSILNEVQADVLAVVTLHKVVEMLLVDEGHHFNRDERPGKYTPRVSEKGYKIVAKISAAAMNLGRTVETEVKQARAAKRIEEEKKRKRKAAQKAKAAGKKKEVLEFAECDEEGAGLEGLGGLGEGAALGGCQLATSQEPVSMEHEPLGSKRGSHNERAAAMAQSEEPWEDATVIWLGGQLLGTLVNTLEVPQSLGAYRSAQSRQMVRKLASLRGSPDGAAAEPLPPGATSTTAAAAAAAAGGRQQPDGGQQGAAAAPAKAFIHDYAFYTKTRRVGVMCVEDGVHRLIQELSKDYVPIMPYMPMLVEPRRWTTPNSGGQLALASSMMRIHGARSQRDALRCAPRASLQPVYEALDVLGRTPWRINQAVTDVVEQLWQQGGNIAGLISRANEEMPEKPKEKGEELREWYRAAKAVRKVNAERHSLRSDLKLKLAVVSQFRNEERFFYPHNLDFRGRAYPLHPHLNHLGSDPCRGILEFADGRPLGPHGLKWLKIHLANVRGNGADKLSYDDRVAHADDNLELILDSARRPLGGDRWWIEAEEPFQCLATCMDIRAALESGDPERHVSYLHVHQDGSCNGLQHYAALGRDVLGAESVNMTMLDKPADVYSDIAAIVRKKVEEDAAGDPSLATTQAALPLLGHVDRKLVKQTVMTSVYGVTFIGARSQIHKQIKEKGFLADESQMYRSACYAARTTLSALSEMFGSARNIMAWLSECAKLVAAQNATVQWVTPLGLPVVQPYQKHSHKLVKTTLQHLVINDSKMLKVEASRQRTAFPPNFVHSLDSTHMMKTAIACGRRNIPFAGVHDSYWTHAGEAEGLQALLRHEFIDLHTLPILENLLESFKVRYPTISFPPVPDRGDFDLKKVMDAPYFFD